MSDFILLSVLAILSGGGALYLVVSKLKPVASLSDKELLVKIYESKSLFADLYDRIINPAFNYWRQVVIPEIYKEFEKIISRIRLNILKIECWLLKLANYIRGKRTIQSNGCSTEYWKDLNDSKNGNGNAENKKVE